MVGERLGRVDGHAFLSYVREDAQRVDRLAGELTNAGIPVWLDTSSIRPGQDWGLEIRRAIDDGSVVFLACFSCHSTSRAASYQNEEIRLAISQFRQRPPGTAWLIPIRFDDCRLPDFDLGNGRHLGSLQRVDLFDGPWPMLDQLIRTIVGLLGEDPGPTSSSTIPGRSAGRTENLSAIRALAEGRNNLALALANSGLRASHHNAQLLFVKGAALNRLHRSDEALEPLHLAHELDLDNAETGHELARALIETGGLDEAHTVSPELAEPHYRRFLIAGGIDGLRRAHELWPEDREVAGLLADELSAAGDLDSIREARTLAPNDSTIELAYISALHEILRAGSPGPPGPALPLTHRGRVGRSPAVEARAAFDELLDSFTSFSPTGRRTAQLLLVDSLDEQVAQFKHGDYDAGHARQLIKLSDSVLALDLTGPASTKVAALRADIYWTSGDLDALTATVAGLAFFSLLLLVVLGIFFVTWGQAAVSALVVFVLLTIAALLIVGPPVLRSKRRRAIEHRNPSSEG